MMHSKAVVVMDSAGRVMPGVAVKLNANDGIGPRVGITNVNGYIRWDDFPDSVLDSDISLWRDPNSTQQPADYVMGLSGALRLSPTNQTVRVGGVALPGDVLLPPFDFRLTSMLSTVPTIVGRDFRDPLTNQRTVLRIASAFRLFERLRAGEDLSACFRQWRDLKFTWLRVFFSYCVDANGNGIGRLIPREYTYDDVELCAAELNAAGFGLYATAIADGQRAFANVREQQMHWANLGTALSGTVSLVSAGNEHGDWTRDDYSKNGFHPHDFGRLPGLLCSRGAGVADVPCYYPDLDFAEFRNRRDQPKMELDAVASPVTLYRGETGARPALDCPLVFDECTKFGPGHEMDGGLAERLAALYTIEAAGLCFHSAEGLDARVMTDETAEIAARWNLASIRQIV